MSPSIHPSSTGAGRLSGEGGGGVSCVSFVMLCRAAIDLEQTTQHISSHVPERTQQQRLLASSSFSSFFPHFFCWQHDLHFVSSSFSCLICISRSNLHAGARLSDTLVLPALFWFCFLLHLHLCSFLLLLLLLFLSSLFLFIYELSVWGFYLKLLRGQRQKKSENWAN